MVGGKTFYMRKNWKKLGIEELQYRYGMEQNVAEHMWENAYRKALRQARKEGVTKDLNLSREVYASTFYRGQQMFNIKFDDISPSVNISSEFADVDDLQKAFTERRFEHMAQKYKDVNKWLNQYKRGRISYQTFRDKVKKFRDTNQEYQKAGS